MNNKNVGSVLMLAGLLLILYAIVSAEHAHAAFELQNTPAIAGGDPVGISSIHDGIPTYVYVLPVVAPTKAPARVLPLTATDTTSARLRELSILLAQLKSLLAQLKSM